MTDVHVHLLRRVARHARRHLYEQTAASAGSAAGLERASSLADEHLASAEARRRRPTGRAVSIRTPLSTNGQEIR